MTAKGWPTTPALIALIAIMAILVLAPLCHAGSIKKIGDDQGSEQQAAPSAKPDAQGTDSTSAPSVKAAKPPKAKAPEISLDPAKFKIVEGLDFTTDEGMRAACAGMPATAEELRDDPHRLAFAICKFLDSTKETFRFALSFTAEMQMQGQNMQPDELPKRLKRRGEILLSQIEVVKAALEGIKAKGTIMTISPGAWEIDLDGDGDLTHGEKYFFWTIKRSVALPRSRIERDDAYYRNYFVKTTVNVDQADVHWALAYCNVAESVLNTLLAYDVNLSGAEGPSILLTDKERISKGAYENARSAIAHSRKLRDLVLKETDDTLEWVPGPKQKDSMFPLPTTESTYKTWGEILDELDSMINGKSLLGGEITDSDGKVVMSLAPAQCKDGGISIRDAYKEPVKSLDEDEPFKCVKATRKRPVSRLASVISEAYKRAQSAGDELEGVDLGMLRYLYWIN